MRQMHSAHNVQIVMIKHVCTGKKITNQNQLNKKRDIKLTIDACGYTWEGLCRKDREIKVKTCSHRLNKWDKTVAFINLIKH